MKTPAQKEYQKEKREYNKKLCEAHKGGYGKGSRCDSCRHK